jgi:hypothetical protein
MLSDAMVLLSAITIIVVLVGFIAWDSRHPSTCFDLAMHYQVFPELWFYLHEVESQQAKAAEAEARDAENRANEPSQASPFFALADLHRDLAVKTPRLDRERN